MTARGKNLLFLHALADIFQLDTLKWPEDSERFKGAFTPENVRRVYECIADIWPNQSDLVRVLETEADVTSALYIGQYEPQAVYDILNRNSLYSESIILVDPFMHPNTVADEYNPLLHPETYRTTTLKFVNLWIQIAPWIESGIVRVIRSPGDFDTHLLHATAGISQQRIKDFPELAAALEETFMSGIEEFKQFMINQTILSKSDAEVLEMLREVGLPANHRADRAVLDELALRRKTDPYYIDPANTNTNAGLGCELFMHATGANYELAKIISGITKSHLITNIFFRWKEMEVDRKVNGATDEPWSPFSKALGVVDLPFLNRVRLDDALRLRQEDRLTDMRRFFNMIWRMASSDNPFSESNAESLATELHERVKEAKDEWAKIDRDLMKWGASAVASALGGGALLGTANALFMGSVSLVGALAVSAHTRKDFSRKYPASFFLKVKER